MKVWVLLIAISGNYGHSSIDNISSEAECRRLGEQIVASRIHPEVRFRCFEVEKVNHPERPA